METEQTRAAQIVALQTERARLVAVPRGPRQRDARRRVQEIDDLLDQFGDKPRRRQRAVLAPDQQPPVDPAVDPEGAAGDPDGDPVDDDADAEATDAEAADAGEDG